jgi:predicted RNA binding protein YcfA (HicA-like mRNA interferase family)
MPRKLRKLRAELHRTGWEIDRQRGSHQVWTHPDFPGSRVTLAGNDGQDAKPYQEREVDEAVRLAEHQKKRKP